MAYSTDFTLAQDTAFRSRIQMGLTNAARQIATEARTVRNEVDSKRNALAVQVLNDPAKFLDRFVYASIEASALVSGSTDANIDTAISSVWNGVAGVTNKDLA